MLTIWNFAHVLTEAVYIAWGWKVQMKKFAKWWRHTLESENNMIVHDDPHLPKTTYVSAVLTSFLQSRVDLLNCIDLLRLQMLHPPQSIDHISQSEFQVWRTQQSLGIQHVLTPQSNCSKMLLPCEFSLLSEILGLLCSSFLGRTPYGWSITMQYLPHAELDLQMKLFVWLASLV